MSRINEVTALCLCGCGQSTGIARKTDRRSGYVKGHPRAFVRGHNRSRRPDPAYMSDPTTGCWNWQGYVTQEGRAGLMVENGRSLSAYVVFYARVKGPVPPGLVLDHLCRNPRCVNPDHLEAVTYAVNNQRGAAAKLTRADVDEIRAALKAGARRGQLAARYAVSYGVIEEIEKGEAWR